MLHVNKVRIPDMHTGWQIKIVNPTKHKAMLNSINRNNNRNHKSSLLQDLTHSHCNHGSEYTAMYCNRTASFGIIFPVNLPPYTVGVRLATSKPQLSATGQFSVGFHLLLPSWTLISVKKGSYVQVCRFLARWRI